MTQIFMVSIPADANYHSLYSLLLPFVPVRTYTQGNPAVTGTEKGILPNLVAFVSIVPAGAIQVKTSFTATQAGETAPTGSGVSVASGVVYSLGPTTLNSICLNDFWVAGSAVSLTVTIQSK